MLSNGLSPDFQSGREDARRGTGGPIVVYTPDDHLWLAVGTIDGWVDSHLSYLTSRWGCAKYSPYYWFVNYGAISSPYITDVSSLPVAIRDYTCGYWTEVNSWGLPYLAQLGLFWKIWNPALKAFSDQISLLGPPGFQGDLSPDSLMAVFDLIVDNSKYKAFFKRACVAISGLTVGLVALSLLLMGEKKNSPKSALFKLK
jgi:hypothetical protein